MFSIKIKNLPAKLTETDILKKSATVEIEQTMKELSVEINAQLKNNLSSVGVSSKPFEVPRKQSGQLQQAVGAEFSGSRNGHFVIEAGDLTGKAEYARSLEYGTSKMLPRPFLRPVLKKYFWILKQKLVSAIKD